MALTLTGGFLLVELVAAWMTQSLALLSDAAHMFTDVVALAIALAAIQIGRRPADAKRTFGYYRFEILAAAGNAIMLFAVAIYIGWEAWQRFKTPAEVESVPMMIVAAIGLAINLVAMRLLRAGSEESLNVKGAYLEVLSDMLGSAGVIAGGAIIWATSWWWVDTVVAIGIALWVIPRTWTLLREAMNVLLEGVPTGIELSRVEALLLGFDGVQTVHALHVWSVSSGRHVMSAHLVVESRLLHDPGLLAKINEALEHQFGLTHTTVQLESAENRPPHCAEQEHDKS
jgi:cobalt-zinc-cadmium efflux system protein